MDIPSHVATGYKYLFSLVVVAVCAPAVVLYLSNSGAGSAAFLLQSPDADSSALSALNAQIAKDESLLRSQEAIVNKAESALLSRVRNLKDAEAQRSNLIPSRAGPKAVSHKMQRLMASPPGGGDPRPPAAPWKETVPDHSHVSLQASINGPEEVDVVDNDKIADWNKFFDGFTKRVDAPKWDVKDLLVDNLDDITPCNIDCDKNGMTSLSDFAFFDNMTRTETDDAGRVHIVDSLDGIDACTIDC